MLKQMHLLQKMLTEANASAAASRGSQQYRRREFDEELNPSHRAVTGEALLGESADVLADARRAMRFAKPGSNDNYGDENNDDEDDEDEEEDDPEFAAYCRKRMAKEKKRAMKMKRWPFS